MKFSFATVVFALYGAVGPSCDAAWLRANKSRQLDADSTKSVEEPSSSRRLSSSSRSHGSSDGGTTNWNQAPTGPGIDLTDGGCDCVVDEAMKLTCTGCGGRSLLQEHFKNKELTVTFMDNPVPPRRQLEEESPDEEPSDEDEDENKESRLLSSRASPRVDSGDDGTGTITNQGCNCVRNLDTGITTCDTNCRFDGSRFLESIDSVSIKSEDDGAVRRGRNIRQLDMSLDEDEDEPSTIESVPSTRRHLDVSDVEASPEDSPIGSLRRKRRMDSDEEEESPEDKKDDLSGSLRHRLLDSLEEDPESPDEDVAPGQGCNCVLNTDTMILTCDSNCTRRF